MVVSLKMLIEQIKLSQKVQDALYQLMNASGKIHVI